MFPLRKLSLPVSLILGACTLAPSMAEAQVTYFQRPPTADQLRAALLAPASITSAPAAPAGAPSGTRSRGIVWQSGGGAGGSAGSGSVGSSGSTGVAAAAVSPSSQTLFPVAASKPAAQVAAVSPASSAGQGSPAAALPINFDSGSSRVDRESIPYIEAIASVMRSDPSIQLVIEGHTDGRGSYNRNMVLSWDRALGVFRTLVETYGVEPKRLHPLGKGPLEPMPGTDPDDGSNRRVQFRITG